MTNISFFVVVVNDKSIIFLQFVKYSNDLFWNMTSASINCSPWPSKLHTELSIWFLNEKGGEKNEGRGGRTEFYIYSCMLTRSHLIWLYIDYIYIHNERVDQAQLLLFLFWLTIYNRNRWKREKKKKKGD